MGQVFQAQGQEIWEFGNVKDKRAEKFVITTKRTTDAWRSGLGLSAKEAKSLRVNIIMRKGDKCQILDAKLKCQLKTYK